MSIKSSLSLIFLSTLLSLVIFIAFLILVDPKEAGLLGTIIFFFSLFIATSGFLTIVFIILKLRALKEKEKIFEKFSSAFRDAIISSLFLLSIVITHLFKLLNWLSLVILFLFFLLLELLFSARKKRFIYKI